ncbi:Death-associated protein kinase related [Carabus blaptoides fortunei]
MSLNLCGDILADIKSMGDGLLNVTEERLRLLIRKDSIYDVYHVEQTPFARGKFATVRKARNLATGVEYAAKFIRKRRRALDTQREIAHEVAVLLQCAASPRVVRLHEVYDERSEMVLVLELAAGGELQRVLDTDECLGELEARRAMRQILEGLLFLHDRNIAHLDLKPQNLLLTSDEPNSDIKLCDFGISRVIEPGTEVREILGTPDYVAPEILSYEPISLATDVWSVGVLGYVLLTGYSPFGGDTKQETYLNISQCSLTFPSELFSDISNTARDFIKSALVLDPRKRPSAKHLLEHPWLAVKTSLLPMLVPCETTETNGTAKSTPLLQRKTFTSLTETPKSQRKTYTTDNINGSSPRTYSVSTKCLHSNSCGQCGSPCCHLTHTPTKSVIPLDRGILC